ncbi:MAG: transcription-repair coupling factor [Clostridia bacterium]|nr:transcription-repair coupling factor [Clostridia bacterium]
MSSFFTYANLGGDYLSLGSDIRLGVPTAVFGVSDPHKYLTASLTQSKFVYIAADSVSAQRAAAAISALTGEKVALLAAKDDVLLYKDAVSKDALYARLTAVNAIDGGARITVCDAEAALQLFPAKTGNITFTVNGDCDYAALPAALVAMGYVREYEVETKGSFAIRGDILDIYPINSDNPVRIDFFGDTVERIRPYDAVSGDRLPEVQSVTVISAAEAVVTPSDLPTVSAALSKGLKTFTDVKAYRRAQAIADDIKTKTEGGSVFGGASFLMPILGATRTFFDVISPDTLIIFDECKQINDKIEGVYSEHINRFKELKAGGEVFDFSVNQLVPKQFFLDSLKKYRSIALQTFFGSTFFFQPLKTHKLQATPVPSYLSGFEQFVTDARNWLRGGYRVLVFSGNADRTGKLTTILNDEGLPVNPLPDRLEALRGIAITSCELAHGIILHESKLAIIGTSDLYTKSTVQKRIRRRRGDMFTAPEIGQYAVHETHGIGKIVGTKKIETTDGIKEYIGVEYKGGDMLYVPVEQMDILSRYVGEENPSLSKIGGAEFERVKERVRNSIKSLAFDLKELYAERSAKKGYCFPENAVMMEEFEDAFKYEETPDQLVSISEIKQDMCSTKVMDRLLCGDVGYGKTEVALRAVYLCVLGGKQAAIMCPSTILAQQHFTTATERFAEFGVRVECLTRFKTAAQQQEILSRLANGQIDLIIGTHRLLSKDVNFYDLGLLVLDEEQRFGVEHKERIKHIKSDVDCLTMTATPIPRTLHMSLSGIRDISTINTPPGKRLPVQTYVVEETETLIRDACIRELSRGGQVFILYNRVESIQTFAAKVAAIVPEAKVCYIHGRMEKDRLENGMLDFCEGRSNILVTTTIIENGIDLPNANTLIVIDADRLGISQLYQLRGRVGRGARLAHAYFTYKPEKILSADAAARLKAIMQFTELGSGFKIAMRDLEIRGAGNVLGAEQHGHMDKVGYELYSKLLKEELTGEKQTAAELDIKATAYIPENYVESPAGRMDCYKQIAEIRSVADYKRVCLSIEDNYGSMPDEVLNLLIIAVLKSYAAKFSIRKITVSTKAAELELASIDTLGDSRIKTALDKSPCYTSVSMATTPKIIFKPKANPAKTMIEMTNFLKFAVSFT